MSDTKGCQSAVLRYHDLGSGSKTSEIFCASAIPNISRSSGNVVMFELNFPRHYEFSRQHGWSGFRLDYDAVYYSSESRYPVIYTGNGIDVPVELALGVRGFGVGSHMHHTYRQTSSISRKLVGNKLLDHYIFIPNLTPGKGHWAKTAATGDDEHESF